ncbi:fimbrial protein [Parabacteroides chinchillae]|uniref:Major fimbrial subunit protein N-terminal domain-containing protein n=1 Tax=Parabacteroides chinchillae TaxID=871327 RepID=A0A8G2BV57_9BACT|nr:fimbrial protein [Parabacteroides chinchillae]SEF67332.1 protein of unknown function [Parabacteroides chinchillae]
MKQYIYIVLLIIGGYFIVSCNEDALVEKGETYEEGIPVTLSLSFMPNTPEVITRATGENQDQYADRVSDITVFAFNTSGDRIGYQSFSLDATGEGVLTGFKTLSGTNYIYAVANLESANYTKLAAKLKDCITKEQFLSATADLSQQAIDLIDGKFLMAGIYDDSVASEGNTMGSVSISSTAKTLAGKIWLHRVVASVSFQIVSKIPGNGSFTPQTWQVAEIPDKCYLFEREEDFNGDISYFSAQEYPFAVGQKGFTFYMMENRKTLSESISYKERYSKKPENATYIILKGYYKGPADKYQDFDPGKKPSTSQVEGDVTYYIPLGEASYGGSSASNLEDYKTIRNTRYTYNVKVKGINDIVLEVVKKEPTSVADGNFIYTEATQPIQLCDAHYEARVLTFTKADIIGTDAKWKPTYKVKTPVNDFQVLGPDDNSADLDDNWIHFVVNNDNDTQKANYPGDGSSSLLTIKQLVEKLKNEDSYTNNKLVVTAFVDEYYYDNLNWWEFANKPNREMLILCKTKFYSDSVNSSSLTDAAYVISQRSIQTYYSTDGTSEYAIGIEWVNETDMFEKFAVSNNGNGKYSYGNPYGWGQTTDGRANMIRELTVLSHSEVRWPNWNSVPYLSGNLSNYTKAYNACMSRNRNMGNISDQVKENEIKWFLPSLSQYQDFVMGQDAYDPAAILFPANSENTLHYYANSKGAEAENFRNILWAEEGISTSDYAEYEKRHRHSVRCARYLGRIDKPDDSKIQIWSKSKKIYNGENYDKLELRYMDKKALRSSSDGGNQLAMHTELSENTKPYKSFLIYNENKTGGKWSDVNGVSPNYIPKTEEQGGCPKGWRIPNQRELTLLVRALDISKGTSGNYMNYVARTKFSGKNNSGKDYLGRTCEGFFFSEGGLGITRTTDTRYGFVRCVRDCVE